MTSQAEQPEWVQALFLKLGPEVMSKPAQDLSGEDLFNIYHVTKDINGADDGVWPIFDKYGYKVLPVIKIKLSNASTPIDELKTAKEIVNVFFSNNKELEALSKNK